MKVVKNINVILDLDNTLISAIDDVEESKMGLKRVKERQQAFEWMNMEDDFKVFMRPGLQKFLTWLFEHFNVGVWTAASKSYALFIVDKIVLAGNPRRRLDFILFSHHCKESLKDYNYQKKLTMITETFPMMKKYTAENTFIIDDHKDVLAAQPDRCIRISPFDVQKPKCNVNDKELERVMKKLELIRLKMNRRK